MNVLLGCGGDDDGGRGQLHLIRERIRSAHNHIFILDGSCNSNSNNNYPNSSFIGVLISALRLRQRTRRFALLLFSVCSGRMQLIASHFELL